MSIKYFQRKMMFLGGPGTAASMILLHANDGVNIWRFYPEGLYPNYLQTQGVKLLPYPFEFAGIKQMYYRKISKLLDVSFFGSYCEPDKETVTIIKKNLAILYL